MIWMPARAATTLPLLIGSGATPDNVHKVWPKVDGLIVGSYLKRDGIGQQRCRRRPGADLRTKGRTTSTCVTSDRPPFIFVTLREGARVFPQR
jgi:hypothetical protein